MFFVFHFHEGIEKQIYLNRSRLTLRLLLQVWSTRYSKQVRVKFPETVRCTMVTWTPKNPLLRKHLMKANVYIIGYFHTGFILMVSCDILTEAFIMKCFPKVTPKVIHKLFKNRKS